MKKIVWFLYILAAVFVVRYEVGYTSYIDIHKYAMGLERAPFQQRALMVPVERWAIHSRFLAKVTGYQESPFLPYRMEIICSTEVGEDMTGCKMQSIEAPKPTGLHDPANIPIVVVNFLSLLVSGWCAVRLYRKMAPGGRLWFLIPPLVIYAVLVTNLRGTYLYDLPSMALFSLGVVCVLEERWGLMCLVFCVGTINRETMLMLIPVVLIDELSKRRSKINVRYVLTLIPWLLSMVILWGVIRHFVTQHLPGVGSELASNLMQNLKSIANPTHWPILLLTLGGLWVPLAFCGRYIGGYRMRWFLWIYPAWLVPMMIRGVITESRIFEELLPLTVSIAIVIFEEWYSWKMIVANRSIGEIKRAEVSA